MSRQNVELIQTVYRRVNEGGFSAIADLIHPNFELDSPQGIESSQVHDKAGLWRWTEVSEWFERLDGEGDSERRRVAEFIAAINGALESRHHLERLAALGPREEALSAVLGLVRSEVSAVGRRS